MKILFLLFCFLLNSFARDCKVPADLKEVDLRSELGPIRDQDSIAWCYAFTAADILGHYLYKTKNLSLKTPLPESELTHPQNLISAAAIATVFNQKMFPDFYGNVSIVNGEVQDNLVPELGAMGKAIDFVKAKGFCLEKDFPSENFNIVLKKFCTQNSNECALNLKDLLTLISKRSKEGRSVEVNCELQKIIKTTFPTLAYDALEEIIKFSNHQKIFYDLENRICSYRFNDPKTGPVILEELLDKDWTNLDKALDRGTIVGIAYNPAFLIDPSANEKKVVHASSLVGRRFNPKICEWEYILRNSYGPSCEIYKEREFSEETPRVVKDFRYEAVLKRAQLQKELATLDPSNKEKIAEIKEEQRRLLVYLSLYSPTMSPARAQEIYLDVVKPLKMRNPRISCDPITGYIFVPKSDLEKNIAYIDYIKE